MPSPVSIGSLTFVTHTGQPMTDVHSMRHNKPLHATGVGALGSSVTLGSLISFWSPVRELGRWASLLFIKWWQKFQRVGISNTVFRYVTVSLFVRQYHRLKFFEVLHVFRLATSEADHRAARNGQSRCGPEFCSRVHGFCCSDEMVWTRELLVMMSLLCGWFSAILTFAVFIASPAEDTFSDRDFIPVFRF